MTSVYVAGASKEAAEVASFIERLEAQGIHITYNWTRDVLSATKPDNELSEAERARLAFVDLDAITRAEDFWLILPSNPSAGCWVELGAALAQRRIIIVSGDWKRSIFTALAVQRFDRHEEAWDWLCQ